jgi:3-methyladenine DNA glycosylase AlkD
MKRSDLLAAEVHAYCEAHADRTQAARYARYFSEGYDAWGGFDTKHPLWNEQQRSWLDRYADLGVRGLIAAGRPLFASGKYEEGGLAIRFLASRREDIEPAHLDELTAWFEAGLGNWAQVDVLCAEVLSPLLQQQRLPLEAFGPWRVSRFKYQRRAVPVAMLGLLKTPRKIAPLLAFLKLLMEDPERVVQQGLGWFLREAWKRYPEPVEGFLLRWRQTAPRLIYQYATEKMPLEARARFKRTPARSSPAARR